MRSDRALAHSCCHGMMALDFLVLASTLLPPLLIDDAAAVTAAVSKTASSCDTAVPYPLCELRSVSTEMRPGGHLFW